MIILDQTGELNSHDKIFIRKEIKRILANHEKYEIRSGTIASIFPRQQLSDEDPWYFPIIVYDVIFKLTRGKKLQNVVFQYFPESNQVKFSS